MPSVSANGLRLHYEVTGAGEPVVLLTGVGTDHSAWDIAQVPALVDAGFSCVAVDHRDAGQSDSSPDGEYSIRDMAMDTAAVLEAAANGPVHVVGFSMGGMIAQELALTHPDKVHSLTLCSTDSGQIPAALAVIASWEIVRPRCDLRTFWQVLLPWCFGEPFLSQPGAQGAVLDGVDAAPHPQSAEAFLRQCRAIRAHDTKDRLDQIVASTHVIAAELDIVHPVSSSQVLAERISGAELTVIPNVGHAAMWEDPASFNEALIEFLGRHRIAA